MKKFAKEYTLAIMVICISIISIGASLFLLKGGSFSFLKNRLSANVVIPSGSLITDAEFYAELVDSYNEEKGTSYDYTHNFSAQELASLKTLNIDELGNHSHGQHVADLSGLAYLTGLENLSLRNISVSSIDLSNNSSLKTLAISATGITTVDLNGKTSLTTADINIPTLEKLILKGANSLTSLSMEKPTNPGYIIVDEGRDISYLLGSSIPSEPAISDNSVGIKCGKYELAIGESTTCTIKAKTIDEITGIAFKILASNGNIALPQTNAGYVKKVSLSGDDPVLYYGNKISPSEFDIVEFTVTGVASGSSQIYIGDYNSRNPKEFIKNDDNETPIPIGDGISATFYVNKYKVVNASGTEVSTGKLQTNYALSIINDNGEYIPAYTVAVLGDVQADGIINIRDVTKAYKGAMKGNYNAYTNAEKKALDMNLDGLNKMTDVVDIYDLAK